MGFSGKIGNKAQELAGQAKEKIGEATDNEKLQAEGLKEQVAAKAKQANT